MHWGGNFAHEVEYNSHWALVAAAATGVHNPISDVREDRPIPSVMERVPIPCSSQTSAQCELWELEAKGKMLHRHHLP